MNRLPRLKQMRSQFAGALLAGALAGISACNDPRPSEQAVADGAELPILRQTIVADSHELRRIRAVARTRGAWARLALTDEEIDFDREMALIVTLGRSVGPQRGVRIARVWREGRQLRVETERLQPVDPSTVVVAAPFCIAIVPRCDLEVIGFLPEPPRAPADTVAR